METLRQKLEGRALDKLRADIKNLANAIEKVCMSNNTFSRISKSVELKVPTEDGATWSLPDILYKESAKVNITNKLLNEYIEKEVNSFMNAVDTVVDNQNKNIQ